MWVILLSVAIWGCATPRLATRRHADRVTHPSRFGFLDAKLKQPTHSTGMRQSAVGPFQWPLKSVKVTSGFGQRGREFHEGVDLRAPMHTPVLAAHSGTVLYAGDGIRGYGKLIVIRHEGLLATLYAHNSRFVVKRGDAVRQGQVIAFSGATGHVSGPHVHFEVREGLTALNPVQFLTSQKRKNPTQVAVLSSKKRRRT